MIKLQELPENQTKEITEFHNQNIVWASVMYGLIIKFVAQYLPYLPELPYTKFLRTEANGLGSFKTQLSPIEKRAVDKTVQEYLISADGNYFEVRGRLKSEISDYIRYINSQPLTKLSIPDTGEILQILLEAEKQIIEMCEHSDPGEQVAV